MPQNDYGIKQVGTDLWVKVILPLELSSEDNAINNLSFADAVTTADYLTNQSNGESEYAPGRPVRKPHP